MGEDTKMFFILKQNSCHKGFIGMKEESLFLALKQSR